MKYRRFPRAHFDHHRSATADALFPLTPALSLGERENSSQRLKYPVLQRFKRAPIAHPLPKGEGWGEGEQTYLGHSVVVPAKIRPYRTCCIADFHADPFRFRRTIRRRPIGFGPMKRRNLTRPTPSAVRKHWPLANGIVFLNHGSFGSCPKPILKLQAELRRKMEATPVRFLWRNYEERLQPARVALAKFIGVKPRDLVFVTNAT